MEQALLLGMGTNHSDAKLRTTITSRNWVLTILTVQASQLLAGCTMVAPIPHPPFPTLRTIQNSCHPRIPMKQNIWFNPNHQKKHRHKRYKRKQQSPKKMSPIPNLKPHLQQRQEHMGGFHRCMSQALLFLLRCAQRPPRHGREHLGGATCNVWVAVLSRRYLGP